MYASDVIKQGVAVFL
jgi:hypothetical protein